MDQPFDVCVYKEREPPSSFALMESKSISKYVNCFDFSLISLNTSYLAGSEDTDDSEDSGNSDDTDDSSDEHPAKANTMTNERNSASAFFIKTPPK